MKRTIILLSGLLAAQVALAVGLNLRSAGLAGQPAAVALLSFPASDVDRLSITDGDGVSVTVAKKDGKWVLPDKGDFPADGDKIDGLLADLTAAKEGAPVATSATGTERFRVADAGFERKLVFGPADKPLATVYLGTSQGARQVHVRRSDQNGVRLVDFGIYRARSSADDWVDATVLKTAAEKITGLAWGDVRIERKTEPAAAAPDATAEAAKDKIQAAAPSETWVLDGDTPRSLKLELVHALTDKLSVLRITGLAPQAAAVDGASPDLDLTITMDGGNSRHLRIWKGKDGDYTVTADDLPWQAKLVKSAAEALIKATSDVAFAPPQSG